MAKQPQKKPAARPASPARSAWFDQLKPWQKTLLTHGLVILAFYVLVTLLFYPLVFQGKVLNQDDSVNYQGMSHQLAEYRDSTGVEPLWNGQIFSGMPAYQAGTLFSGNLMFYVEKYVARFGLPRPANYIFLTFVGFFFLLLILDLGPWVSGLGAAAYALSSYWFIIHVPGHVSKAAAIAYMAFLVASVLLTYRGKYLLGGALTAFFMALEVNANHYQISYYLAIALLVFGIAYFVDAVRNKTLPVFFTASAVVLVAALIGVGPNVGRVWTTAEYASVTMRGGSELPGPAGSTDAGLDKEYAFRWSYGISETFTLLIPNFHGGASVLLDSKSDEFRDINRTYGAEATRYFTEYWGEQPITSGPVYVGAIVCFLFVLGLMLVNGPIKWWLLAVTILSVLLAWGSNSFVADLFFDYFPAYNKFRAPSMTLVLAEFTMPFLGILGLHAFFTANKEEDAAKLRRALFVSAGVMGGLSLLLAVAGSTLFDFTSPRDENSSLPNQLVDLLVSYRAGLLQADALRSAALIFGSAALLLLYLRGSLKMAPVVGGLAALVLLDMVPVSARYLDVKELAIPSQNFEAFFKATPADQYILSDTDLSYRVFNLNVDPTSDKITPYHHQSIGGYHAAKLRRYQDLIDSVLNDELMGVRNLLQSGQLTDSVIQAGLARKTALNMLNTRYLIYNPQAPNAIQNLSALGNAWFVSSLQEVNSPQEELLALQRLNPATTAVVDVNAEGGKFGQLLGTVNLRPDSAASIALIEASPRRLKYRARRQGEGIAVFSEIYYNDTKGWTAYVDGEQVPHARVNYVLRALVVPSGESEIEFRFEPQSYHMGETVGLISSILVFLLLAVGIWWEQRSRKRLQA